MNHLNGPELVTGIAATGKTRYLVSKALEIASNQDLKPLIIAPYRGGVDAIKKVLVGDHGVTVMTPMDVANYCRVKLTGNLWGHEYDTTWIHQKRMLPFAKMLAKQMRIEKGDAEKAIWFMVAAERNGWSDEEWHNHLWLWFQERNGQILILVDRIFLEMQNNNVAMLPMLFSEITKALKSHIGITEFTHVLVDDIQMTPLVEYLFIEGIAGKNGNITAVADPNKIIRTHEDSGHEDIIELFKSRNSHVRLKEMVDVRMSWGLSQVCMHTLAEGDSPLDKDVDPIKMYRTTHELVEADKIIQQVMAVSSKYPDRTMLVTYRSHWVGRSIVQKALGCGLNVDMRGYGNESVTECFDVISDYLSLSANPFNGIAFLNVMNKPGRRLGDAARDTLYALRRDRGVTHWYELIEMLHEVRGVNNSQIKSLSEFSGLCNNLSMMSGSDIAQYILNDICVGEYLTSKHGNSASVAIDALEHAASLSVNATECMERLEVMRYASRSHHTCRLVVAPISQVISERFDYAWIAGVEHGIFPKAKSSATDYWDPSLSGRDKRVLYTALSRANHGAAFWSSYVRNIDGNWKRTSIDPMISRISDLSCLDPDYLLKKQHKRDQNKVSTPIVSDGMVREN